MKRAHLGWQRFGRDLLQPFGLTPARFDLLFTVRDCRKPITQSELRKRLGVVRSAVSEMIAVLEKLALLRRTRGKDKRTWQVKLTKRGRLLVKSTYAALIGETGLATAYVDEILTEENPAPLRYQITKLCFRIARRLGNRVRRNMHLYCWDLSKMQPALLPFI